MERQDQVARLRQPLADSKALIQQLLQNTEVLEQQIGQLLPCKFFDLPLELREWIYELCLAPGKFFIRPRPTEDPRLHDYDKYEAPQLQLLAVNRQIRQEAAKILFTKNQIVLNNQNDAWGVLLKDLDEPLVPASLPFFFHEHVTSVSIALGLHDYWPLTKDGNMMSFANYVREYEWDNTNQEERENFAHVEMHDSTGHWERMLEALLQQTKKLRFLQVDLTNCYCILGTCRLVSEIQSNLTHLYERPKYKPQLEAVEILGTKTANERRQLLNALLHEDLYCERTASDSKLKLRFKAFKEPKNSTCTALHKADADRGLADEEFDIHEMLQMEEEAFRKLWAKLWAPK